MQTEKLVFRDFMIRWKKPEAMNARCWQAFRWILMPIKKPLKWMNCLAKRATAPSNEQASAPRLTCVEYGAVIPATAQRRLSPRRLTLNCRADWCLIKIIKRWHSWLSIISSALHPSRLRSISSFFTAGRAMYAPSICLLTKQPNMA